jgi:phosphopantothenoylcysteine decarboxylase/phosphopantothenate--cysteine ligase
LSINIDLKRFEHFKDADVYISAAAVGDYRPESYSRSKIKKGEGGLILKLERTPDVLKLVGSLKRAGQVVVGFAAETEDLLKNAEKKLVVKNLDAVVANDVKSGVFGSDETTLYFVTKNSVEKISGTKEEAALKVMELISGLFNFPA